MEFQLSYFKSLKTMQLKFYTQHVSKFEKLSSGHRTRKSVFILLPKKGSAKECTYYWIIALTSHAEVMLKILKLGFSSPWTENFQVYELGLEKAKGSDQIASIHWIIEKQRNSKKHLLLLHWLWKKTVWITTNWKIIKGMGIPNHLTCLLRNLYVDQKATVRTLHGTTDWFKIGKRGCQGCILSPCLFNLYAGWKC